MPLFQDLAGRLLQSESDHLLMEDHVFKSIIGIYVRLLTSDLVLKKAQGLSLVVRQKLHLHQTRPADSRFRNRLTPNPEQLPVTVNKPYAGATLAQHQTQRITKPRSRRCLLQLPPHRLRAQMARKFKMTFSRGHLLTRNTLKKVR